MTAQDSLQHRLPWKAWLLAAAFCTCSILQLELALMLMGMSWARVKDLSADLPLYSKHVFPVVLSLGSTPWEFIVIILYFFATRAKLRPAGGLSTLIGCWLLLTVLSLGMAILSILPFKWCCLA